MFFLENETNFELAITQFTLKVLCEAIHDMHHVIAFQILQPIFSLCCKLLSDLLLLFKGFLSC